VPDLCTLGKVIGGGFPLAAVAGGEAIMAHFDKGASGEDGFMPMIGTLSGNPIAATAGLATLKILKRPGSYDKIFATGRTLMANLSKTLKAAGIPAQVVGEGCMFDVVFTNQSITDYWSSTSGDKAKQQRFDRVLLENGVIKGNSKFYISLAHDEADIGVTSKAFEAAADALAREKAA
jgi:glutamate-1-semialdehyde 2,1-aminomutase